MVFLAPGSGEVAFVAGRKVGGAVHRNRVRRVLRAAFRDVAPRGIAGRDAVVVGRAASRSARTQDLVSDLSGLLETEAAR